MNCSVATVMTVSDPATTNSAGDDVDHRLHPLSWLFVLLTQLRSMILPIIAFVVFGKGDSWIFAGLLGAFLFALYALIYSLSFRYRIGVSELLVRSGILFRTERHVPYERIQNIVQKRNLLHRMFDVTELRLESAGGSEPEAVMNVITVKAAAELERVLKHRGADADLHTGDDAVESAPWLQLGTGDLLRLGLLNDRGWVAVGAVAAVYWQFGEDSWNPLRAIYRMAADGFGAWTHAFAGWTAKALSMLAIAAVLWLLIKLLSMAMAVISFYRFRLSGDAVRLSTEAGLLTRHVASARRDKIQRLIIGESWIARMLGRRWLSCEVAAGAQLEQDSEQQALRLRWLVPIGTAAEVEAVAARVVPGLDMSTIEWKPLHPRAWRRLFNARMFWWSLLLLPALYFVGPLFLLPAVLLIVLAWCQARGWARFAAYACDGEFIAFRAGWLSRRWTITRIDKGQTLALTHTPFDRRRGMQTLSVDTAGATLNSFSLAIPYLPIDEAQALADVLRLRISAEP